MRPGRSARLYPSRFVHRPSGITRLAVTSRSLARLGRHGDPAGPVRAVAHRDVRDTRVRGVGRGVARLGPGGAPVGGPMPRPPGTTRAPTRGRPPRRPPLRTPTRPPPRPPTPAAGGTRRHARLPPRRHARRTPYPPGTPRGRPYAPGASPSPARPPRESLSLDARTPRSTGARPRAPRTTPACRAAVRRPAREYRHAGRTPGGDDSARLGRRRDTRCGRPRRREWARPGRNRGRSGIATRHNTWGCDDHPATTYMLCDAAGSPFRSNGGATQEGTRCEAGTAPAAVSGNECRPAVPNAQRGSASDDHGELRGPPSTSCPVAPRHARESEYLPAVRAFGRGVTVRTSSRGEST